MISALERARQCCGALNASGLLRVPVSPRSGTGLRLRDLAGAGQTCELITYWGIWSSLGLRAAEHALLNELSRFAVLVSRHLACAARFQIIVTDTHARLNGVPEVTIATAINELKHALPANAVLTRMSEIVPDDVPAPPVPDILALPGGDRLLHQARRQAAKLFPEDSADGRADAYVAENMREAPYVLACWPSGIFFHIGPPELKLMLPSLPLLYGYAGHNARTRKPWFS